MRSAKETGCFPYRSKLVCFMELSEDGEIHQLKDIGDKRRAYYNAIDGKSKILAVWPGNWRSDLFIIDDLSEYGASLNL